MMNALILATLMAIPALAGCLESREPEDHHDELVTELTSVFDRAELPFNMEENWSFTLLEGAFDVLPSLSVFVNVPLPVTEGGAALDPEGAQIHLGLFMPDIPGCDFGKAHVDHATGMVVGVQHTEAPMEYACQVPVIADVGPYYTESDVAAEDRGSGRLGEWLISTYVPHGYAVAQVSVLGSGKSNHCFDMFGMAEQLGVHHVVEWLGSQGWSNGNVGLIGRSYDGSTPWMAAALGSEFLKTIVPISGLSGLQDLVTWNGASEARILTFHNVIYGTFGVPGPDPASAVRHRATCPDWVTAAPLGAAAYATGDDVTNTDGTYWAERSFVERSVANYEGSIYLIHGLLDDNVDPHAGTIGYEALVDKGLDAKAMMGQWGHNYPDRVSEHPENPRYDWAQEMLEWFDYYLMETGPAPDLHVQVEMQDGRWRVDDALQPSNANRMELGLVGETGPATSTITNTLTWNLGALSEDDEVVMAGLSTVSMTVTPSGPGGQLYVELFDATTDQNFGLSYGITELRHAPGGESPVVPGVAMNIDIPLQYFAAALPAGHELGMTVRAFGNDFLPSPVVAPVLIDLDSVVLHLSTLDAGPDAYFVPPMPAVEASNA